MSAFDNSHSVTIMLRDADGDIELQAISHIASILDHLDSVQRQRALNYLGERYQRIEPQQLLQSMKKAS